MLCTTYRLLCEGNTPLPVGRRKEVSCKMYSKILDNLIQFEILVFTGHQTLSG